VVVPTREASVEVSTCRRRAWVSTLDEAASVWPSLLFVVSIDRLRRRERLVGLRTGQPHLRDIRRDIGVEVDADRTDFAHPPPV
jgi:hypothetical protein